MTATVPHIASSSSAAVRAACRCDAARRPSARRRAGDAGRPQRDARMEAAAARSGGRPHGRRRARPRLPRDRALASLPVPPGRDLRARPRAPRAHARRRGRSATARRSLPRRTLPLRHAACLRSAASATTSACPGASQHPISLDTLDDAERFHRRLLAVVRARRRARGVRRLAQVNIVIIGAGATGVELAAEIRTDDARARRPTASSISIPARDIRAHADRGRRRASCRRCPSTSPNAATELLAEARRRRAHRRSASPRSTPTACIRAERRVLSRPTSSCGRPASWRPPC